MPIAGRTQRQVTVQSRAASLEAELSAVRQLDATIRTIQNLKRNFPALLAEFSNQLHSAIDDDPPELPLVASSDGRSDSNEQEYGVEKLVNWFKSRNNEPASIPEMSKAIGLSDITVKSIIYRRHKEKFACISERGKNNRAFFMLVNG